MYRVITEFYDLADNNKHYSVGDTYPREGLKPTDERIAFLAGSENKVGVPVIQIVADAEDKKPKRTRKKA